MLRVAVPNKGALAEKAAEMLREAGYRQRTDPKDLVCRDEPNDIEFFYLRPKDIATYVGSGDLQLGITGADLMDESGSQVRGVLPLGFGHSKFRFAAPDKGIDGREWKLEDLEGKKIATSYPRHHQARRRRGDLRPAQPGRRDRRRRLLGPHAAPAQPRRVRRPHRRVGGHDDRA